MPSGITSRFVDPSPGSKDFAALARLHNDLGVDGIGPDWWEHVGRTAWQRQNSRVYRLYERDGRVVGFLGVAPLSEAAAKEILSGGLSLWWEVGAAHILDPKTAARARFFGCTIVLDAYVYVDTDVENQMRWDLRDEWGKSLLRRILLQTSSHETEARAQALGMQHVLAGELLPSGFRRRLWKATPELYPDSEGINYSEPFIWHIFDEIRAHFRVPNPGLGLTVREQEVAYLHFCEGLSAEAIAKVLGLSGSGATPKSHIKSVHRKMYRVFEGHPEQDTRDALPGQKFFIASYLRRHPGELRQAGARLTDTSPI